MSDVAERPEFEYLLTGRAGDGRTDTKIVNAPSADEAVRQLEEQGYIEVVLHTDDITAFFVKIGKATLLFTPRQLAAA